MKKAIEITKAHLEKAEADLKECPRGANHGRVNALRDLLNALLMEALSEAEAG